MTSHPQGEDLTLTVLQVLGVLALYPTEAILSCPLANQLFIENITPTQKLNHAVTHQLLMESLVFITSDRFGLKPMFRVNTINKDFITK